MSFRKTDKVPLDKFKLENILRIHEYHLKVNMVLHTPWQLKFGDEKPLKGADLFNGAAQKDPFTGTVPAMIVNSDFQNMYNIIGFCSIDALIPCHNWWGANNDSRGIHGDNQTVNLKRISPWWRCPYSRQRICTLISRGEWFAQSSLVVWNNIVTLPTCCPELNPIELLWNTLVKRLKTAEIEWKYNNKQPESSGWMDVCHPLQCNTQWNCTILCPLWIHEQIDWTQTI